jgi:hypothetical protein
VLNLPTDLGVLLALVKVTVVDFLRQAASYLIWGMSDLTIEAVTQEQAQLENVQIALNEQLQRLTLGELVSD